MSLKLKLREKQDAMKGLHEKLTAMLDTAAAEGRAMNDDERKSFDEQEAKHKALGMECEALKADIKRREALGQVEESPPEIPPGEKRKTGAESGKPVFGEQTLNSEKDKMRGFAKPRDFFNAVMLAKHPDGPRHQDAQGRILRGCDERLMCLRSQSLAAGSDEANTISGEWFIPPAFHPDLLMIEPLFPAMAVTEIPMESPKVDIPARIDKDHTTSVTGGLTVTRRPETTQMSGSRMKTEPISLVAAGQYGLAFVTEELLNDSPLSIASLIERGFQQEFQSETVKERLYGQGSGEFLGVMNSPCLITVARDTTTTVLYADVVLMLSRLWGATRPGTCWLYSPSVLPKLMQLTLGTTLYWPMWQPSAREGEPDRLFGIPAYRTEYCAQLGTTGDIILGQWSEYLEGTYQQMQTAESIHVRFEWNERVYRFYRRNAGAPWWKTVMTPAKQTTTLSPFVCLSTK